jgi:hypothetical protein
MKKKATPKLALNRETLLDLAASRTGSPDDSCVQSCYLVSCGATCEPPLPSLQGTAVQ